MNTKVLVLGAVVAAFSLTAFAGTNGAYLLKASANSVKAPADTTVTTIAYVETTPALLSPRAAGNQIKVVQGVVNDVNPALVCRNTMIGSPRAVAECSSHTTMPACVTIAPLK